MQNDYPLLRSSLAPPYANADVQQLAGFVRAIYGPEIAPEDVEGFFDDIGRGFQHAAHAVGGFAQQAAPVLAGALPSIAQGASAGAAFGPWGALIGGLAGGASGILKQSKDPTARGIGDAIHGVGSLVSTVRGGGASGALGSLASIGTGALGSGKGAGAANALLGAGGGGASNGLLGMLARPEILQALMAGAMGGFGRQEVPVGNQAVSVQSLLSALSTMAGRAAHEAAELDEASAESVPNYVLAASESLGIDADDAEGRTDALLTLLALSPSIWATQTPNRPVIVNVAQPDLPPPPPPPAEWMWLPDDTEDWEANEELPEWDEELPEWGEAAWDEEESTYA